MILLTLWSKLLINSVLSEIFTPPMIATNGGSGVSRMILKALISLYIRKPAHLISNPSPIILECARWAVPKASFTYMSASARIYFLNVTTAGDFSSSAVSSLWKRTFSNKNICPLAPAWTVLITSSPTTSPKRVTGLCIIFYKATAIG